MNLSSIKSWWQGLQHREQRLVLAMVAATLVFLLYTLLWQPLNENLINTEKKLNSRQALLSWVADNTTRYQQAQRSGNNQKSSASLSSIVNRTANQQQLTITRLQPQGDNVQVGLDNVSFTQLLFWLENLANNEGLQVQAIDLNKADAQGEVRVRRLLITKQ